MALAHTCDVPCVADALIAEGVPLKVAFAKIDKLERRGWLECGVGPRCAWPTEEWKNR